MSQVKIYVVSFVLKVILSYVLPFQPIFSILRFYPSAMQASIPILNITWIYQNCLIWEHLNIIKAQCGLRMCCTFVVCPICVAGFLFSLLRLCCGFVMCSICVKLGSPLEFITASHFRRGNLNWGFSNSCRVHWTAFCFNMYFYTFIQISSWILQPSPRQLWSGSLDSILPQHVLLYIYTL